MKIVRIILFSPLALIRLLFVVLISAYVTTIGWVWLKTLGFSRRLQEWVVGTWGRSILFMCGIKIDSNELPTSEHFILMPNHRSYIDIFIVAATTPAAMVGKAEIAKWPFGALGARVSNSILVDRKNQKSLLLTMKRIKESVDKGMPVILFPEGTTYKGPLTKKFKNGSFKIAADGNIPVIPMAIDFKDVNDAWVDKDTFVGHFFRQLGKPFTYVTIRYGNPISETDHKELQTKTKAQIDSMLTAIQNA
ncbi:lysophospholipid acyltransferase family protein [Draconibacterium sp. IB214405]|uniref:lysophospholipid acyltransferase family protein n=1 Tax=Draconibacterium sp. IB214405 TaxID=3097352 RepID=UPI002A14810C|nr:lysophospholipid acyltransferase family protein [Draconibacterium sp. IB214405]MDX8338598.1 lysophospholipid acyltransferase family protein [Draconibacterium sp. IB214405]